LTQLQREQFASEEPLKQEAIVPFVTEAVDELYPEDPSRELLIQFCVQYVESQIINTIVGQEVFTVAQRVCSDPNVLTILSSFLWLAANLNTVLFDERQENLSKRDFIRLAGYMFDFNQINARNAKLLHEEAPSKFH